jgi:uncharacterized protein YbbK (DUF523 family)
MREGRAVSICPEVAAGMSVPRSPAEISNGDGHDVLAGGAAVVDTAGNDVTRYFELGARKALSLCRQNHIRIAVLAESSPSCGSSRIYDGSFTGRKIAGAGVTTALLQANGIQVFSQFNLVSAEKALQTICR